MAARRRWRWDPDVGELVEVSIEQQKPAGVMLMTDIPPYVSPVSGKLIDGRRARREDLKRTGCRPFEGKAVEAREAAKVRNEADAKFDRTIEASIHSTLGHMPERVRRALRGR